MRKTLILAACCLSALGALAQVETSKGSFSVEVATTPFKSSGETFKLNEGTIKGRWFFSDNNALRLKIGVGVNNTSNTVTNASDNSLQSPDNYTIMNKETITKNKNTSFNIGLGYERHFNVSSRISPYVGAELVYGLDKWSATDDETYSNKTFSRYLNTTTTTMTNTTTKKEYTDSDAFGANMSGNIFAANIFAGIDFYVYKGLYIGTELGLGYKHKSSPNSFYTRNYTETVNHTVTGSGATSWSSTKNTSYSSETGVTTGSHITNQPGVTAEKYPQYGAHTKNEGSDNSFKFYVIPEIRIGYTF